MHHNTISRTEIRWRCERFDQLIQITTHRDAMRTIAAEAHSRPWEQDPRPEPAPLFKGTIHDGEIAMHNAPPRRVTITIKKPFARRQTRGIHLPL